MKLVTLSILVLLSSSSPAQAEDASQRGASGQEGKGGKAVFCQDRPAEMLDYFHARIGTDENPSPRIMDLSGMDREQVARTLLARLSKAAPLFGSWIEERLTRIGPMSKWLNVSLRDIPDTDEVYYLPRACAFGQAAARQGPVMYKDPSVTSRMSRAQQGVLKFHEAVYLFAEEQGQTTSANVRTLMRALLQEPLDLDALRAGAASIGFKPTVATIMSEGWTPYHARSPELLHALDRSREFRTLFKDYKYREHGAPLDLIVKDGRFYMTTLGLQDEWTCDPVGTVCKGPITEAGIRECSIRRYFLEHRNGSAWASAYSMECEGFAAEVRVLEVPKARIGAE